MKTAHDWGFIAKGKDLPEPKLEENRIFHALTTAYENNSQQELFVATETIMRREKELCELALGELRKVSDGRPEVDPTLQLILDHYRSRLQIAKEKENQINALSEDSRKMVEEYRQRNQELAQVKHDLMESQSKLRELTKTTEGLLKKEEELRFIERNLKEEIEKNKRNILNGLYEIVAELSEGPATPEAPIPAALPKSPEGAKVEKSTTGLYRPITFNPGEGGERSPRSQAHGENRAPLRPQIASDNSHQRSQLGSMDPQEAPQAPAAQFASGDDGGMGKVDWAEFSARTERIKLYEPDKGSLARSLVKTPEGEIIAEFFYKADIPKADRHYVFNLSFLLSSLTALRMKGTDAFEGRLELALTDLRTRLGTNRQIHLEKSLQAVFSSAELDTILGLPRGEREAKVVEMVELALERLEALGDMRSKDLEAQFNLWK